MSGTPENLWNGAGAPEPGDIGYLGALKPGDAAYYAMLMGAPPSAPPNLGMPASVQTETPEEQAARTLAGDPTGGDASNLWNGTGAAPVADTSLQPGQSFPGAGTTDIWGNTHTGAFYDNPSAFLPPNPEPNPGTPQRDPFYPQIFYPGLGNPASGWFSLLDYLTANQGRLSPGPGISDWSFQQGSNMQNSTNDYRLFGGKPGQFMINGRIIDFSNANAAPATNPDYGIPGHSGTGLHTGSPIGIPVAFTLPGWSGGQTFGGYPGDATGYHQLGLPGQ